MQCGEGGRRGVRRRPGTPPSRASTRCTAGCEHRAVPQGPRRLFGRGKCCYLLSPCSKDVGDSMEIGPEIFRERVRRVQARASSRRATQRAELAKAWGPNDPVLCRFQNPSPPIDRQNPPPILSPATASNLDAPVGTRASRHIARLHLTGTRLSSAQTRVRRLRQ
jgi:hypothetical protein